MSGVEIFIIEMHTASSKVVDFTTGSHLVQQKGVDATGLSDTIIQTGSVVSASFATLFLLSSFSSSPTTSPIAFCPTCYTCLLISTSSPRLKVSMIG